MKINIQKLVRVIAPVVSVFAVLILCVMPASAAVLDYNDYITNIQVDGDNDIVTVTIPLQGNTQYALYENGKLVSNIFGNESVAEYRYGNMYHLYIMPNPFDSILLSNIPNGTKVSYDYSITENYPAYNTPIMLCIVYYYMDDGSTIVRHTEFDRLPFSWGFPAEVILDIPDGAVSFSTEVGFTNFSPANESEDPYVATFALKSYTLTMTISSLYRLQQQTGQTNVILKEVEKQLADQGKTLDEVLQQQQQTNDKLDDMQGSIETLPGQIGDEMQGVIDKEKEESKGEGNKFVDQILDALPDPSTDVLAALKGLTDATAYTGTDAVLPIPAIVLPGIDGLFPQTEIWGGTQFDFGEYIGMLPPALLTLVQSLFTIAIVLFCVYELKGIISYCLTLRENKGG